LKNIQQTWRAQGAIFQYKKNQVRLQNIELVSGARRKKMQEPRSISQTSSEFLRSIYFDATATIRHYDGVRATFTQIFAAILAAFTSAGATLFSRITAEWLLTASTLLALLSCLAILAVLKLNDLIALQRKRAATAMRDYQDIAGDFDFVSINLKAREASRIPFVSRINLGAVWVSIFAMLGLVNLGISALALFNLVH